MHQLRGTKIVGFTADVLGRWIQRTLLDPWKVVPLLVLAKYTVKGREIIESRPLLLKALRSLATLAVLQRAGAWLDRGVLNNGVRDHYDWNREVVVLTGGSGGIGRRVAQLLADRGIKVAILDITPPADALPNSVRFF